MKKVSLSFIVFLTIILIFLAGMPGISTVKAQASTPATPSTPQADSCSNTRVINVSGSALINVTPDRALIQLGLQSNGVTVDAVQSANDQAMQKVISAIKSQGIEAKDIATDLYLIEPVYENYDSLYIKGYRINNSLAVTVRDIRKTSDIIAASLKAGANQVTNVSFYTSELRKYRDQARELAMTAAKEKAQALTAASGAETGCVLTISENSWSYYNGWWYGSGREANQWTQNVIQNAAPSSGSAGNTGGDEPISLGQISVKAEVTVSYALK